MSGKQSQKVMNVDGAIYDAVTFVGEISCAGCELPLQACDLVGCYPGDREDGLWAIWKRRITNTPVEASSQRLRDAEVLERMNSAHVG